MNLNNLKVLKSNSVYRIGDLFYCYGNRWEQDRNEIINNDKYNGTILKNYLNKKRGEQDYFIFKKAIEEYITSENPILPSDNELVIHLRCGDIFSKEDSLSKNYVDQELNNLTNKVFQNPHLTILNPEIQKITIVTALHYGSNQKNGLYFYSEKSYNANIDFLQSLNEKFINLGVSVNLVSNKNPDLDICYLYRSKFLVPSTSSFSKIISFCLNNNAVKIY